ncbi:hypothetical protein F5B21DRAFT_497473 [Xylaria acuta]|nr:hypothetical protein F5B21DRAFT_497473 [Xylaria acuta]
MGDSPSCNDRRSNAERDFDRKGGNRDDTDSDGDEDDEDGEDDEDEEEDEVAEIYRQNAAEYIEGDDPTPDDQVGDEVEEIDSALARTGRRRRQKSKPREQTYTLYAPKTPQRFNVVVCDEAHLLKNHKSAIYKTVKSIDRQHFLAVTATPMLNNVQDIFSLLLISMPKSAATYTPPDYSYHTMYGIGEELDLVNPTLDPREGSYLIRGKKGELVKVLAAAKRDDSAAFDETHPMLEDHIYIPLDDLKLDKKYPIYDADDPEYDAKWDSYEKGDRKWWQLQPCNARWAAKEFGETFDGARLLLRPICQQLCVKRGMQTPLTLPDGRVVRPGDQLKGACFRVVNLQFKPEDQLAYNEAWNFWGKRIYTLDPPTERKQDAGRGEDLPDRPANNVNEDGQPRINTKAVRHLILPGHNIHNIRLLEPRVKTVGLVKVTESAPQKQKRQSDDMLVSLSESSMARSRKDAGARMGVEEVLTLIKNHPRDGGANWVYEVLKAGPEYAPINNRRQFIHFHAYRSPITCAMILQVYEWMKQPRGKDGLPNRVVIMANMPWIQQETALILQMWGWKVETIRSDHTVQERNACIDKFNDPDSDVDILLTSMDLSAYGLNLHKCCCKGIIIQWPWNANHLLQILGRLPRIGQMRFVEWVIFHMAGTIYDKMQTIVWSKYVKQLAVESKISNSLTGVWAEVAAHGKIQELFNLPHNRWLWDRTAFQLDVVGIDGVKRRNEKLSLFFERLATLLNDRTATPPADEHENMCFYQINRCQRNDLVAGAYRWMQEKDQNYGTETPLTYAWLVDNCDYNKLLALSTEQKRIYLSDAIIDQLDKKPTFVEMETEVSSITGIIRNIQRRGQGRGLDMQAYINLAHDHELQRENRKRRRAEEEEESDDGDDEGHRGKRRHVVFDIPDSDDDADGAEDGDAGSDDSE